MQRPLIGQCVLDLEDVQKTLPEGLHVPGIPAGAGDSPFHLLHIEKELHPTLASVVLHQLHEPQHLHTEQTFYITPLVRQQRKIKKVLLPLRPSPAATSSSRFQNAAAGVISAIATGGNVHEGFADAGETKVKTRATGKKKEDEMPMPVMLDRRICRLGGRACSGTGGCRGSRIHGRGGSRSRTNPPVWTAWAASESASSRLPPWLLAQVSHPVNVATAAAHAAMAGLHHPLELGSSMGIGGGNQMDIAAFQTYYSSLHGEEAEESDEEVTDDEEEMAAEQAGAAGGGGARSGIRGVHGQGEQGRQGDAGKARSSTCPALDVHLALACARRALADQGEATPFGPS